MALFKWQRFEQTDFYRHITPALPVFVANYSITIFHKYSQVYLK